MGRRKTNILMLLVMLVVGIANIIWAEKLPVGEGLGWDGVNYAAWAKNFYKSAFVDRVEDYYVQRLLPSALVHYGARAAFWPFYSRDESLKILNENNNIILCFGIYNLALLVLAVYTWGLIADQLLISDRGKWFGFCFLFVNYAILKLNFYAPVSTDTSGFVLGLLLFYFFLARKPFGLLAVMIAGSFTWPTLPFLAWLLLVLPYPGGQVPAISLPPNPGLRRLALLFSLLACAAAVVVFVYILRRDILPGWNKTNMVRTDFALVYSSIAAVIVYLFCGLYPLLLDRRLFDLKYVLTAIQWRWITGGALVFLGGRFVVHQLAGPVPSEWTSRDFLVYIFASALTEPFIFLVSHTVYYGPIVLLLILFWKPFCVEINAYGIGFRLFVALNLLLSVCPQSRFQMPSVGALIIILMKILDKEWFRNWSLSLWLLLSLFYSKIWYTFNTSPMNPDGTIAGFHTFPLQNLFMNIGPWMSPAMYLVQGCVVLATGALLIILITHQQRLRPSGPRPLPIG